MSKETGKYQAALVYQNGALFGDHRFSIAPYSIVPTLIAVILKLCWATLDSTVRRLAPFLQMLKRPQKAPHSMVSYLSTSIYGSRSWQCENDIGFSPLLPSGRFPLKCCRCRCLPSGVDRLGLQSIQLVFYRNARLLRLLILFYSKHVSVTSSLQIPTRAGISSYSEVSLWRFKFCKFLAIWRPRPIRVQWNPSSLE